MSLPKTIEFAHALLTDHIGAGDRVIDATMGNGHDTLHLARLVGETGKVYAFDIQPQALQATAALLQAENLYSRCVLIQQSHVRMQDYVTEPVSAVIFNLGYLPGADKGLATQADQTLLAVQTALSLLGPGGLLMIAVYWGHPAGVQEKNMLDPFAEQLPSSIYRVLKYEFVNRARPAPYLLAIERFKD